MKKIVYTYCNTSNSSFGTWGFGHKAQTRVITDALKELGHEVLVVEDGLPQMIVEVENNIMVRCRFTQFDELSFIRKLEEYEPDYVFSDFNLASLYVTKRVFGDKIKTVAIDSQSGYSDNNPQYKTLLNKIKEFADIAVNPCFYGVTPPIISEDLNKSEITYTDNVLVYLPNIEADLREFLIETFKGKLNFWFFGGFQKQEILFNALKACKFVIGNGGHGLISEALFMHKPLICFPIVNHTEKEFNSEIIQKFAFGVRVDKTNIIQGILQLLNNFEHYKDRVVSKNLQQFNAKQWLTNNI